MQASVVDLRYKMSDVLKALDRNEKVQILYHGKVKGIINPIKKIDNKKVKEHPLFGMTKSTKNSVVGEINNLRSFRYNDI